jgi:hypothetical protein
MGVEMRLGWVDEGGAKICSALNDQKTYYPTHNTKNNYFVNI